MSLNQVNNVNVEEKKIDNTSVNPDTSDNEWICPNCSSSNYNDREQCRKCKTDRPANIIVIPSESNITTDWICINCNTSNYSARDKCRKCETLKEILDEKEEKQQVQKKGIRKHGRPEHTKKHSKPLSAENEKKLKAALIETLPHKLVNNNDTLHIYMDGYNIIGCDRQCRDYMYKSKDTKYKARQRMAELVQHLFIEKIKSKLEYKTVVHLWFDGHIDKIYTEKNEAVHIYKDVEITHTPIDYVVDDKLVDIFSKIGKEKNSNVLVITSDRELAIRLYECGVHSMKSGRFYKQFLKN